MALFWWNSYMLHCSILTVLSQNYWDSLKLHKPMDARNSAITSHGSVLGLITVEVKGSWIISCQKVLELQQKWILCAKPFAWILLFSFLNAEWNWGRAEIKRFARGWTERHKLQGERGGIGDSWDICITWQLVLSYQHALQGKLTT